MKKKVNIPTEAKSHLTDWPNLQKQPYGQLGRTALVPWGPPYIRLNGALRYPKDACDAADLKSGFRFFVTSLLMEQPFF